MQKFIEGAELIDAESRMKNTMWGRFWSSHQRFFKYLCIASKVNHAVHVAREAIKYGKCVVISLQSMGEAPTLEQLEKDERELIDFVSTAKGVFQSLVEKHFPAPDRNGINHILGLTESSDEKKSTIQAIIAEVNASKQNEEASSSSSSTNNHNKRKSARQELKSLKKSRSETWHDSDDDHVGGSDNESDFKLFNSDTEESDNANRSDSAESSDFNPFR
uniref:Uncharacterized protein n=1 Tax=Glossina brevipalpis TaxID=37001 RepID=A0A1A9WV69_9MUSC